MSILASLKAAKAGINLAQIAMRLGLMALVVSLAFLAGKNDQKAKHARKEAEITKEYAGELSTATGAAYARGRDSLKQEMENNGKLEDIIADAIAAEGAGNLCLSADLVDQLRNLQ